MATHGYIGLGFSPGGGMHGADIMLAWVDTGGQVHVTDRHAVGNNVPYLPLIGQSLSNSASHWSISLSLCLSLVNLSLTLVSDWSGG